MFSGRFMILVGVLGAAIGSTNQDWTIVVFAGFLVLWGIIKERIDEE